MLSFESFFTAYYERTRRMLAVLLSDPLLAEEAAQEAFYRAWRRWSRVSQMDRPDSWVFVVGLNHGRDLIRRRARDREGEPKEQITTDEPAGVLDLVSGLVHLPPRQQEAIVLRYLLDMSVQDVAGAMQCAVGTVKSTLHAALESLRVQLTESAEL